MTQSLLHRKGTVRLRLIGPDGAPWQGKQVHFSQLQHQFLFGCGAFQTLNEAFGKE